MYSKNRFHKLVSMLFIVAIFLSSVSAPVVSAQGSDGLKRQVDAQSGKVSFIGPENGRSLPAFKAFGTFLRPQDPGMALAKRFAPEFGIKNPERELTQIKKHLSEDGRVTVRYQQKYEGIPVLAGELIVNTNERGDLYSMSGEVSSGLVLPTQPRIDSAQAAQTALQALAKWYEKSPDDLNVSEPELWIFDESLLKPSTRPAELVWRMEVTPKELGMPVRELVLVNAERGNISLHFNQVDTAWTGQTTSNTSTDANGIANSSAFSANNIRGEYTIQATVGGVAGSASSQLGNFAGIGQVWTYTANNTTSLPGSLLCNQSTPNCTNGINPHADAAHKYAIGTYDLYASKHLRDSIDDAGMTIISTVHYDNNYYNAFWDGTQAVYGDDGDWPLADDVVAHELTHGVTERESNLFYFYQSGAINESFSDLWGEYYDQTNSQGTDTVGVKWLVSEDIETGGTGAIRNMNNPLAYGDPDRMTSSSYYNGDGDNGGVHHNSGINNKAVSLLVDGGSFNGETVAALGWDKTAAIYYEANTNLLTTGSNYSDLYYALQEACKDLTGQNGITTSDCDQVKNALDAVEMNAPAYGGFYPDAPVCALGQSATYLFQDNFESGTGNWDILGSGQWYLDNWYATSPTHMMWGSDYYGSSDSQLSMKTGVFLPAGPSYYLHFHHAFLFEYDSIYYDGGVLEYSTNNGATWLEAASLFSAGKNYTGVLDATPGTSNTLAGRSAFVGDSHGYVSSRYNLTSLAGQTVKFRWRFATDQYFGFQGWTLDDVQIYTCTADVTAPTVASITHPISSNPNLLTTNFLVTFSETVTGVSQPDFALTSTGVTGAYITGVSGSGTTYTVTVYTGVGNGTLRVDVVDNDSVKDGAGLFLGGSGAGNGNFTSGETYALNKTVEVHIAGQLVGGYAIPVGGRVTPIYSGINNGPVKVVSPNGTDIITSERAYRGPNYTDWNEMLGFPADQLTTEYWFPLYDTTGIAQTFLSIGNASPSTSAEVSVYIAGQLMGSFIIPVGGRVTPVYAGINNGPVQVKSTNGVPIITSERAYRGPNYTDWNEMLGFPANQLTTEYWFPLCDGTGSAQTFISIGNASQTPAEVTIKIAGQILGNYIIPVGGRVTPSCPGINNGPVQVYSTNGTDIIVSERAYRGPNYTDWNEMLGFPADQLTTEYWFPLCDGTGGAQTFISIGNASQTPAEVTVKIAGQLFGSYTIPVGGRVTPDCAGINNGPVQVYSTNGTDIIVSERAYRGPNYTDWNEMLGLPVEQLTTEYWFPLYDTTGIAQTFLSVGNASP